MKMQKFTVLLFTLLFTITTFAQTEKGKIYIGASSNLSANFMNSKTKDDNNQTQGMTENSGVSISPEIGFLITDNLVLGVNLGLSFNKTKYNSGEEFKSNTILAAPFVKYYFSQNQFKPFLFGSYGFGSSTSESIFNNGTNESSQNFNRLQVGGGVAYFINEFISLELGINYLRNANKQTDNNPTNITFINSGIVSSVGFAIFL